MRKKKRDASPLNRSCGFYYERKLRKYGCDLIIGVDEVGRGPLAGPVVAAAVALSKQRFSNRIDDSKKLSPCLREKAFYEIIRNSLFGIGIVSEKVIDRLNILEATRIAMQQAVESLLSKIDTVKSRHIHILVDGNIKFKTSLPLTSIIKGDAKSKSIASASIVAKVIRDRIMSLYDTLYPEYGFSKHKGYPTGLHRERLRKLGPSLIHRISFRSA
ncbi:ribonuclease HII [bacterium]|nr:MAG: ribonuclease HII [bacterium]